MTDTELQDLKQSETILAKACKVFAHKRGITWSRTLRLDPDLTGIRVQGKTVTLGLDVFTARGKDPIALTNWILDKAIEIDNRSGDLRRERVKTLALNVCLEVSILERLVGRRLSLEDIQVLQAEVQ